MIFGPASSLCIVWKIAVPSEGCLQSYVVQRWDVMCFYCGTCDSNARQQQTDSTGRGVDRVASTRSLKTSYYSFQLQLNKLHGWSRTRLLIVGPWGTVWKVLRETDGERFVLKNKVAILRKNFAARKIKFFRLTINSLFRVFFMWSSILSLESCLHFLFRIRARK